MLLTVTMFSLKTDSLKPHYWGEYLVEVFAFNLGEALRYKPGFLSTIRFFIEYPAVLNDLASLGAVNQVINISLSEGL